MATNSAVDKYFEALTESYDAIIDAIKLGNERGYRVSSSLLSEAQRGQREAVELGRTFAGDPTDVGGFYRAMMESTTKAQGRALELTRQMFDELSESRSEARETIEKVVKAQRAAGEAAVAAARDVAGTTADRVRTGVERVTNRAAGEAEDAAGAAKDTAAKAKKATAGANGKA
jgi:DNA anti-recombination protein RmuC